MKRILIIANKSWEADAALSAILNDDIRHRQFDYTSSSKNFTLVMSDFPRSHAQGESVPRAVFETDKYSFEIWCLQNIMAPNPDPKDGFYYSRSLQKAIDFLKILKYGSNDIEMIIAFGTAGVPTEVSKNGGVIVGSGIFAFDANSPDIKNKYANAQIGTFIQSSVPDAFFDRLNAQAGKADVKLYFETTALIPPINPAGSFAFFADKNIAALSCVNVGNYGEFKVADVAALKAFAGLKLPVLAYSVETTHAIMRMEGDLPNFIFVTAVTDRDAYFDYEVTPKVHAQNFTASFNGGIFLSWLIPFIQNY